MKLCAVWKKIKRIDPNVCFGILNLKTGTREANDDHMGAYEGLVGSHIICFMFDILMMIM